MEQKAVLFDLDGTLTDSGEGIMKCAELALRHFGLPVPDTQQMRTMVGPPLDQSFIRFGVRPEDTDEAIRVYRSRYTTLGKFENYPYPGIHQVLARLKADGYRLYVATSKLEGLSVEILERFELAEYFDRICGATPDNSRSSKASVIAYLLDQIGPVDKAVMVGDTEFDVLGAKEHGIPTIGVAWGYGKAENMKNAGAAAIADDMDHLYRLIREMI